ncbi:helix-turn-helix domain-containing protein [Streptomyces sp. WAC 00631]|uniref:helix-turn-helix domain-containing protein n=1 Tax=Streptomyces sp. WAC 00631 TaxID=2203201 RepID=UPI000F7808BA|nr:helix-turn-helix transcriptional regulator [Streptomyces sp. WAC 00631]MCC5032690.1 helix-turn-helix domain-containing protein [Streptomyces sp. WAC 00631]
MDEIAPSPGTDPRSSTLAFFGAELRLRRKAAGLTQRELARTLHCAPSLICKIEAAVRAPQEDFAERCDEALGTDGLFSRLWPVMTHNAYPVWFRPFVELEQQAASLEMYGSVLVPGLMQTEGYARALFSAAGRKNVEELVSARMHRQRILEREEPPRVWVVLDEGVLRREIGSSAVMREQLARLIEVAESPPSVVQVVPACAGAHPGLKGAFNILRFADGPDILLQHGFHRDELLGTPEALTEARHAYELLRAVALAPDASVDLIATVMRELKQ